MFDAFKATKFRKLNFPNQDPARPRARRAQTPRFKKFVFFAFYPVLQIGE